MTDPNPKVIFTGGATRSTEELPFDLIELFFLERMARVMLYGKYKYDKEDGKRNWKQGTLNGFGKDIINHIIKHAHQVAEGDLSEDHFAHIACNAMFAMWYEPTGVTTIRVGNEIDRVRQAKEERENNDRNIKT